MTLKIFVNDADVSELPLKVKASGFCTNEDYEYKFTIGIKCVIKNNTDRFLNSFAIHWQGRAENSNTVVERLTSHARDLRPGQKFVDERRLYSEKKIVFHLFSYEIEFYENESLLK